MKQFLKKVIMSDRHMPDGQLYSFLQIFFNTEKTGYHCNRLRVAHIHWDTTLINNEPLKIYVHPTQNVKKLCNVIEHCFSS